MGVPYRSLTLYKANFEARDSHTVALGCKQTVACVHEEAHSIWFRALGQPLDMTMEKCFHVCVSGFNFSSLCAFAALEKNNIFTLVGGVKTAWPRQQYVSAFIAAPPPRTKYKLCKQSNTHLSLFVQPDVRMTQVFFSIVKG